MERPKKSPVEVTPEEKKGAIALPTQFLKLLGVVPSSKTAETSGLLSKELQEQGAPQGRPDALKRPPSIDSKPRRESA
jgi:hypothetical protein